jgi:HD-GYP domain-containing protein (c-di-GMP phosphodiesterase class II)
VKSFRYRPEVRAAFARRGHIVVAMLAVLIAVGIVPLATMSWKLIGKNRETLTREKQEYQVLLAASVAREIDLHVEGLRSEVLRVAQTLGAAVRRRGTTPVEQIERVLGEVTDARVAYVRYSYFHGDAVKAISAGDYPDPLEPLFEASLRRAAEEHAQSETGPDPSQTILSDPFFIHDGDRRAMLAVAAPVEASGAFRGVLTALVDLDRVWKAVALRNDKAGHLLFAVDERGEVFASSDVNQVGPSANVSEWGIVQNYLRNGKRNATLATPFEIDQDGKTEHFIGTYELTQQGWGIFTQAREEEILWVVGDMERSTLTWTLVLFGVAVLAATFFARTLSNPINRLAAASRALAKGDFSARVHVRSRNEIGELAHTFNRMAADIEIYIRRLKKAFEENNELFLGTIRALAQAIDAKDPYTRGHSVRVNRYSMILGRELGLSESELRDIHVSSLLHDVGKIGIDDAILKKQGELTEEEYEIIKTHAALGGTIMAPIPQMKPIIPGLRHHHERCNGRGYPDQLTRDQIPMMARIIAVADTYDAITTVRPYQNPMTFDEGVARINALRGAALDDQVVEAFNRACAKGLMDLDRSDEEAEKATIPPPPLQLEVDLVSLSEAEISAPSPEVPSPALQD